MKTRRSLPFLGLIALLVLGTATTFKSDHGKFFEISKNIEIYTTLYKEINTHYVDDLDPAQLMRTGVDAMLASLDPYTNYISETEIEGFRYITEGRYNGIGAKFDVINGLVTITEPYEGSPAIEAGLKAGDQIIEVDGKDVTNRDEEELGTILKGYPGTEVRLKVRRPGTSKPLDIALTRDEVQVPNVPYSGMISDKVGYVALTTFTRDAGRNVAAAVKQLKDEHPEMTGLVFDLRGNGGGLLTEAVNVSNVWIPKGELVVTTKGKVKDRDRSFKTLNNPVDENMPLVVLINNGSASASEIVSGVLQDYDRAVLLGQRSYGKGLVQNTRDVGYNSKVKLTIAKYYIPSGRCIQSIDYQQGEPADVPDAERAKFQTRNGRTVLDGGGVKPDVVVDKDAESDVLEQLQDEFLIFDYVTQFALQNESIGAVKDFRFTQWDDFLAYLDGRDFDFNTESERLLAQLREAVQEDGYAVSSELRQVEQTIIDAKKNDLNKYKDVIIDLIEKEIASRYYFQDGKIQMGLRNDQEIVDAIELLGDPAKYQSLLK